MSLLETNEILVREHFGVSRVRNSYDILDAASGEKLGEAIEEASGLAMSFLKLTHWDSVVPFDIHFIEKETGNLFGWNFQFVDENKNMLASVGKNWSGFKNELLASADTYAVKIDEEKVPKGNHALRILVLAAAVCIDMIYKQH